jgi:hypothetical protein
MAFHKPFRLCTGNNCRESFGNTSTSSYDHRTKLFHSSKFKLISDDHPKKLRTCSRFAPGQWLPFRLCSGNNCTKSYDKHFFLFLNDIRRLSHKTLSFHTCLSWLFTLSFAILLLSKKTFAILLPSLCERRYCFNSKGDLLQRLELD